MTITHRLSSLHLLCAAVAMLVLHSCSPEPAFAATPLQLRWTAELSDPKPYQAVLFAGETADLQATLKLYGRAVALETNATAALYWQTNGMASAWWSVPATVTTAGVVTASWTPSMDAGADLYRWHIGVANAASSTIYRAFGAFRMQPSPGAAPNILDLPARWIDFDLITISNAPWATPADVAEATEGMLTTEADPVALPVATQALATAQAALPAQIVGGEYAILAHDLYRGNTRMFGDKIQVRSGSTWTDYSINGLLKTAPMQSWYIGFGGVGYFDALSETGWSVSWPEIIQRDEFEATNAILAAAVADKLGAEDMPDFGFATSNWVESIRGVHADIASNVVWHVVVSNGHWLIREVQ